MKQTLYKYIMILPAFWLHTAWLTAQSAYEPVGSPVESRSGVGGASLDKLPEQMLSNTLSGKIAGLTVMRQGGEPGKNTPLVYLRGKNTYNDNAKMLTLVDGFESDIDNLLPEEIESVTVLKDAAALAVYGIRGANGVLLVTTKRGTEGKMRMSLNLKTGFMQPLQTPRFLDAYGYASLYNEALSNDLGRWVDYYTPGDLASYRSGNDPYFHPNVDWQEHTLADQRVYESGNFTISGGNSSVRVYALLGFLNTPKFYNRNKNTNVKELSKLGEYSRYNIRTNVDVKINRVFGLSANLGGAITDSSTPNTDNLFSMLYATPPNAFPVRNEDNTWAGNAIYTDNPAATLYAMGKRSSHIRNFQTDFALTQDLGMYVKGLSLKESASFYGYADNGYNIKKDYLRYQMVRQSDGSVVTNRIGGSNPEYTIDESEKTRSQMSRSNYQAEAFYNRIFGAHQVRVQLGAMYSRFTVDGNNVPYLNAGLFGRLGYEYANRYIAQFSFAYNGSENLPAKNRYGFFPSLAVGWILSNEGFMKNAGVVDFLKLRLSAGLVGSSDLGATRFGYQTYYDATAGKFNIGAAGSTSLSGLIEGRIGNPNISYEKNYKYNVGVDAMLFKNLSVTIDGFYEVRDGILATRATSVPAVVAMTLPFENLGRVSNAGGELELAYRAATGDWTYGVSGNVSYARNKIEYQAENIRTESYLYRTGKPTGQYFGLEATGFFQSQAEIDDVNTPRHTFAPVQPGDIRYKDQNGDGFIDENDEVAIGHSSVPQVNYGASVQVGYKGFDLSATLYGQACRSIQLSGNTVFAFYNNGQAPAMAKGRWAYYPDKGIDTRATADYPRLTTSANDNNYRASSFWVRNASFMRLENLELGYTFRKELLRRARIEQLRIYVDAANLLTVSPLDGFDPEAVSGYPMSRSFSLGLHIQF